MLALALALGAALLLRYGEAQEELARLQAAGGATLADRRPSRPLPKERLDEQASSAEAVVRQLTLPWGSLIGAMEQAATGDVALLQLQPDAEQRLLRLTAQARHRDAMFEYLRRLSGARGLADVHLVSHQIQRDDPQHAVQFSAQAAVRDER